MNAIRPLYRMGLAVLLGAGVPHTVLVNRSSAQPAPQSLKPVPCEPSSAADATVRIRPTRAQAVSLEDGLGIPRVRHWLDLPPGAVVHETELRFRVFRAGVLMVELAGEDGSVIFQPGKEPTLTLDVQVCETGSQTYLLEMGPNGIRTISPDSISGSQVYFQIPSANLYLLAGP